MLGSEQSMPLFRWFPLKEFSPHSVYLNSIHAASPSSKLGSLYFLSFIIYSTHLVTHQVWPLVTVLDLMFLVKYSWTYVWLWARDGKDFRSYINAQGLTLADCRALLRRTLRAYWEWWLEYKNSDQCWPWAESGEWQPVYKFLVISALSTLLKASEMFSF